MSIGVAPRPLHIPPDDGVVIVATSVASPPALLPSTPDSLSSATSLTPLTNVRPSRHAAARVGTVFGGGGDMTRFKKEWQAAQEDGNEQEEQGESEQEEDQLDQLSDEEWSGRIGICAPHATVYRQQQYVTIDDDIADFESNVDSSGSSFSVPPAHSQKARSQLLQWDVERAYGAHQPAADAHTKRKATIPANINYQQIRQIEQRTIERLPETSRTNQTTRDMAEEKEPPGSHRALAHTSSSPAILLSSSSALPSVRVASSPVGVSSSVADDRSLVVLSPRSRYSQLSRACADVLPVSLHHARPTPNALIPEPTKLPPRIEAELTKHLTTQQKHTGTIPNTHTTRVEIHSNGPMSKVSSPRGGWSSPSSVLGSMRSPSSFFPASPASRSSPSSSASPSAHSLSLMRALHTRSKLRSEFLRDVDRALDDGRNPYVTTKSAATGIAAISNAENQRIATHRAREAQILAANSGATEVGEKEFSSAAVLAAHELHALPPVRPADPADPDDPLDSAMRSELLSSLAAAAARAADVSMVQSPFDRSPALSDGHAFMRTHAMHHHVTRNADRRAAHAHATTHDTTQDIIQPCDSHSAPPPPLPSHSPALQLQSPSSQSGWQPPSLACISLTEKIYYSTKRLGGLISAGDGKDIFTRHLASIKPSHLVDDARKKSLAAAAVERMQQFAAEQKAKALKAKMEAGAAIRQARIEAREAAKREKREREDAHEANLLAEVQLAKAKLDADERAAEVARNHAAGHPPPASTLTVFVPPGIDGPVSELDESALSPALSSAPEPRSPQVQPLTHPQPQPTPTTTSPNRMGLWARVKSLTDAPLALPQSSQTSVLASAEAKHKFKQEAARVNGGIPRQPTFLLQRPPSVLAAADLLSTQSSSLNFSVHRIPRTVRGSTFGPMGEDLTGQAILAPATFTAGHMLDASVEAADERHTQAEKKKMLRADYNAVLARLYQRVTPQEKRMRRFDQPKASQHDIQRIVQESLGDYHPNARKRTKA